MLECLRSSGDAFNDKLIGLNVSIVLVVVLFKMRSSSALVILSDMGFLLIAQVPRFLPD